MINLEVKIPDRPGSLIELIKPISESGGNIYGILHYHDKKINNLIPVDISFELAKEVLDSGIQKIKQILKEKGIQIEKITFGIDKKDVTVILTGHVFDTDVMDTIKRLASQQIFVSELQAKFTDLDQVSNVKMKLNVPESMSRTDAIKELYNICNEKNLFIITS